VADVAGLDAPADAAAWRGVRDGCAACPALTPTSPFRSILGLSPLLQGYAGYDLVIAGTFLLTDPVLDVAQANPERASCSSTRSWRRRRRPTWPYCLS